MQTYINEFQKYFKDKILKVRNLNHRGNNQIFEITLPYRKYILKKYSVYQDDKWDRGNAEFKFVSLFWQKGFRDIPEPISFYDADNVGIYSFEKGEILKPEEVKEKDIIKAVDFITRVHNSSIEDKRNFFSAREACYTLWDYIKIIDARIENVTNSLPEREYGKKAKIFLDKEVYPIMTRIRNDFFRKTNNFNLGKRLSLEELVISAGDFGFHNVLVTPQRYVFLDFEYSGINDPVVQISHFIHQATSRNIKKELKQLFLDLYKKNIPTQFKEGFNERFNLVEPLVIMDWVLHQLNILSPTYIKHIQFAYGKEEKDAPKYLDKFMEEKLEVGKEILKRIE